ncbi:MAG: AMP-binding protein, partial [Chloroflexota bacterium]
MNLAALCLDENVRTGRAEKTAVVCGEDRYSYGALATLSARVASGLGRLGVRPEERAIVLLPDSVEFVAAFMGIVRLGAVAVPLNTLFKPPDYAYLLEDSRAAVLVVHAHYLPSIPTDCRWLRHVVVVGAETGDGAGDGAKQAGIGAAEKISFEALLEAGDEDFPATDMSPDAAAFWL